MRDHVSKATLERLNLNRPNWIYKFSPINEKLISSLRESYLWYSMANSFNDPFDCYAELLDIENHENLNGKIDSLDQLTLEAKSALKNDPEPLLQVYKSVRQKVIDTQGVCCFTKNFESTLMWSHYANCHKGVCLVWDYKLLLSNHNICPVNYTEDFRPINFFEHQSEALLMLLTTKSAEWKYENELRALRFGYGKVQFEKECLKGIIFGCNTSKADIDLIRVNCNRVGYNNLKWHKAAIRKGSFKFDFIPV